MDFELSSEQKDIQKAAREFIQGEYETDQTNSPHFFISAGILCWVYD